MKIYVILPAAGSGSRAGFEQNKILRKIGGRCALERTLSAFAALPEIAKIAVCVSERDREEIRSLLAPFPQAVLTAGGETRTQSVKNALESFVRDAPDYVLIHDAARPFVSRKIIRDCIDTVRSFGSAVCALPCTDTLVRTQSGMICEALDRESACTVQTPQGFSYPELLAAYRKIKETDSFTDDSGVYAKYVAPPRLFWGEQSNRKLTFREDFAVQELRTGVGIDTHAFGKKSDHIVLGGGSIPCESGLIAHSDGDVLCHALMDALLSAAGLCDIGHYFPDTDPQYENADSLVLLAKVRRLLEKEGFCVENVSAAIVAQRPRLAPHIAQMKKNIADVLQICEQKVGLSAGTNEGLGYLGRGEGITVTATVLLRSDG